MALRPDFVDAYIEEWQRRLDTAYYAHRKYWPLDLFHHAPLENAVEILRDGHLRSRDDLRGRLPRDVAAQGVLDTRDHAHSRVRLYFRPKTPTQWNIEGIRKHSDCKYGDQVHAPVLVMFALEARKILVLPDVQFSNQNMQLSSTQAGSDEAYFSQIPFAKVFSEGSTGGDRSITDARCAEVLPSSPLALGTCLRAIYFRSEPERDTLLHLLGRERTYWERYCFVSDALKVFQKDFTFVQVLQLTNHGVVFRVNPRRDRNSVALELIVRSDSGKSMIHFYDKEHSPQPPAPTLNWIYKHKLKNGTYNVEVKLEGHTAYKTCLALENTLF